MRDLLTFREWLFHTEAPEVMSTDVLLELFDEYSFYFIKELNSHLAKKQPMTFKDYSKYDNVVPLFKNN